jgi:hypothetical protein
MSGDELETALTALREARGTVDDVRALQAIEDAIDDVLVAHGRVRVDHLPAAEPAEAAPDSSDDDVAAEDDAPDEHACDVDGCDYATDTERGLAIHQGRVHDGDGDVDSGDDAAEDDTQDTNAPESSADDEIVPERYQPDDYGTATVTEDGDGRIQFSIARAIRHFEDDNRVHVRKHDGRVEIAPGPHEDWPDYSARSGGAIQTSRVLSMLRVGAGDEVRLVPDGDVVVLEPEYEGQWLDLGPGVVEDGGGSLQLRLRMRVRRYLGDPGRVHVRDGERAPEIWPNGHDDYPDYALSEYATNTQLGAKAVNLCGLDEGDEIRAWGDRARDLVELHPLDEHPAGDGDETADTNTQEATADGGAIAFQDYSATTTTDDKCENCGADLVDGYAAVFEAEDAEQVRACPNCEDKVRERDGTVRLKRQIAAREEGDS